MLIKRLSAYLPSEALSNKIDNGNNPGKITGKQKLGVETMGISGLLPLLKPIHKPCTLASLKGLRVGVDTYVWLHKGGYGCALDLIQGKETRTYINYCMRKVQLLISNGITPVLVFDGDHLPSKAKTESDRATRRNDNYIKVMALLNANKKTEASECARLCVDITPAIAKKLVDELKKNNIEFVVAPYEADAQLTYLQRAGFIDAIITEDSDLLVYGCDKILFKMESNGAGTMINSSDIGKIKEFRNWTPTKFRHMCILSGCDYAESINGVGLKKARKALSKQSHWTGQNVIESWMRFGKLADGPEKVPAEFLANFHRARVYDPVGKVLVYLTEPTVLELLTIDDFVGPGLTPEVARGIAEGELDPITKLLYSVPTSQKSKAKNAFNFRRSSTNDLKENNKENLALEPINCSSKNRQLQPSISIENIVQTKIAMGRHGHQLANKPRKIVETISTEKSSHYFGTTNRSNEHALFTNLTLLKRKAENKLEYTRSVLKTTSHKFDFIGPKLKKFLSTATSSAIDEQPEAMIQSSAYSSIVNNDDFVDLTGISDDDDDDPVPCAIVVEMREDHQRRPLASVLEKSNAGLPSRSFGLKRFSYTAFKKS